VVKELNGNLFGDFPIVSSKSRDVKDRYKNLSLMDHQLVAN